MARTLPTDTRMKGTTQEECVQGPLQKPLPEARGQAEHLTTNEGYFHFRMSTNNTNEQKPVK